MYNIIHISITLVQFFSCSVDVSFTKIGNMAPDTTTTRYTTCDILLILSFPLIKREVMNNCAVVHQCNNWITFSFAEKDRFITSTKALITVS